MGVKALSSQGSHGVVVLGYAVTPLHPGVGRSPGIVDLPVQRDPMGYPIVFASSIKGALKAECGRRLDPNGGCFNDEGRLACSKGGESDCSLCCCLFGHEPGEEQATGLLSVLDFIPLAFPVPSLDRGYVYVTTPYLARRVVSILDAIDAKGDLTELRSFLSDITESGQERSENPPKLRGCLGGSGRVAIVLDEFDGVEELSNCQHLGILEKLGGLAQDISSRLVVVPDDAGPLYVEKSLVRITRVRLNIATKTVSGRALWTEEYIPAGTLFLGGLIATLPKRNKYCRNVLRSGEAGEGELAIVSDSAVSVILEKFREAMKLDKNNVTYMVIGGKETIGKGLVKLQIHTISG